MKAFLMGVVLMALIAVAASFVLSSLPGGSDQVNTSDAVRLN